MWLPAADYAERGFHPRAGAIEPTTTPPTRHAGTGRHRPITGMLDAGILARQGNDDDHDDRDTHRADSAGDGIRRLGRRRSRPTAGTDAARLLRLPPLL